MTSHYYAVADAGGTIYPGTFAKDPLDAQLVHLRPPGANQWFSIPCEATPPYAIRADYWQPYADRGDHVVKCRVETEETVKVTILPDSP